MVARPGRRTARSCRCPGVAPGRDAAGPLRRPRDRATRLRGQTPAPFRYRDKGNLATIGRAKAVADVKGLQLSGFLAWVAWLVVHLFYLIGFQNRLLVLLRWTFSFVTRRTRRAADRPDARSWRPRRARGSLGAPAEEPR